MNMVIRFADDASDSFVHALNALSLWTVKGEWTNNGFPSVCAIVKADDDGVTICEVDEGGVPILQGTWQIGYDEIISITVL